MGSHWLTMRHLAERLSGIPPLGPVHSVKHLCFYDSASHGRSSLRLETFFNSYIKAAGIFFSYTVLVTAKDKKKWNC